jgi:hypothetical protein
MKKSDKIKILNELIERANQLVYTDNGSHRPVKDDALSFIYNSLDKSSISMWEKRIKDIRWSLMAFSSGTPDSEFRKAWEHGKYDFVNVLNSIKREVELYTSDDIEINTSSNNQTPIIFLSHSSSDKAYADALEKFITGLGVKNDQLI